MVECEGASTQGEQLIPRRKQLSVWATGDMDNV